MMRLTAGPAAREFFLSRPPGFSLCNEFPTPADVGNLLPSSAAMARIARPVPTGFIFVGRSWKPFDFSNQKRFPPRAVAPGVIPAADAGTLPVVGVSSGVSPSPVAMVPVPRVSSEPAPGPPMPGLAAPMGASGIWRGWPATPPDGSSRTQPANEKPNNKTATQVKRRGATVFFMGGSGAGASESMRAFSSFLAGFSAGDHTCFHRPAQNPDACSASWKRRLPSDAMIAPCPTMIRSKSHSPIFSRD